MEMPTKDYAVEEVDQKGHRKVLELCETSIEAWRQKGLWSPSNSRNRIAVFVSDRVITKARVAS